MYSKNMDLENIEESKKELIDFEEKILYIRVLDKRSRIYK